jgi:hypothetical protein
MKLDRKFEKHFDHLKMQWQSLEKNCTKKNLENFAKELTRFQEELRNIRF